MSPEVAQNGHRAMSDLSPLRAEKRTLVAPCYGKSDLSVVVKLGLLGPASFERAFLFDGGYCLSTSFSCISFEIWRAKKVRNFLNNA
jgi:hypothetical protein